MEGFHSLRGSHSGPIVLKWGKLCEFMAMGPGGSGVTAAKA